MNEFWMIAGTLVVGLGWMLLVPAALAWLDGRWTAFKNTYAGYQAVNVAAALLIGLGTAVLLSA